MKVPVRAIGTSTDPLVCEWWDRLQANPGTHEAGILLQLITVRLEKEECRWVINNRTSALSSLANLESVSRLLRVLNALELRLLRALDYPDGQTEAPESVEIANPLDHPY